MNLDILPSHRRALVARPLLLIFAFTAWSLTGPANVALALLLALFLWDLPTHWGRLRREPAFWLLVGVVLVSALLALRAVWLFPSTAPAQWQGAWAWSAPFLFLVIAWWLREDAGLVWPLMGVAALGLVVGVLRKSDWSLAPQVLEGMRYHFGYAALGLAFIASVILVGLLLFLPRIVRIPIAGRPRPIIGWTLWVLGLAFLLGVLAVTQSRGALAGLFLAGLLYALARHRMRVRPDPPRGRLTFGSFLLVLLVALSLLWATKGRYQEDWQALTQDSQVGQLSYTGSLTIRMNLHLLGAAAFAAEPLLGFGPGTSTTEFLIPEGILAVGEHHRAQAPKASHLHSVALEVLARFGLVGVLIAVLTLGVLLRAFRSLSSDPGTAPDLKVFLGLGGAMLLFFCLYDFRVLNQDLRFFCILFLGILYGLHLGRDLALRPERTRHG